MEQTVFELDLLEEARDSELFKKLDGTEIWEFSHNL